MLDDLRYAIRGLARSKVSALVLLVSLGLGTGANAVLYTAMNALLFQPPRGVRDARRLVTVQTSQYNGTSNGLSSYPDYLSLKSESSAFEALAALDDTVMQQVRLRESADRVRVAAVSTEFFTTVGVKPHAGRLFSVDEPDSDIPPAVISFRLWTMFGASADVIGTPLRVGEREYTIVGITQEGFDSLQLGRACDVWLRFSASDRGRGRGDRRLTIVGRLANGASPQRAQRDADEVAAALADRYPDTNRGTLGDPAEPRRMTVARYSRLDSSERRQVILIGTVVFGATGLLLFSACMNAGTLLLSRSAARRRELAVKVALGASRSLLVRQILIESLFVSLAGAALGLLLAYWTAGILPPQFAPEEAQRLDTDLDATIVIAVVLLSVVAGVLFAIGPSRHATQTIDTDVLRADSGTVSTRAAKSGLRTMVVSSQVALSTVLLVAAALLIDALSVALSGELGKDTRGVATAFVRIPGIRQGDVSRGIRFHQAAEQMALKIQGAEASGWVATLPVGRNATQAFAFEVGTKGITEIFGVDVNVVTSGYFHSMRIPVVEGRLFNAGDGALAKPVVIVNDVLARRYFGPAAVGQRVRDPEGTLYEIVGVVRSGKYRTLQEQPEPTAYFAVSQRTPEFMNLVVRTSAEPDTVFRALRNGLTAIDSGVNIERTATFDQHLRQALTLDRLITTVVAACGVVALVLATIGVYGVIDDRVRRRTPEIGLRVALGANPSEIRRLVFSEGLQLTTMGAIGGVAAILLLTRLVRLFVHGLPSLGLANLAIVPCALALVVVGAAVVPMRRALRVSPTVALRAEG